MADMAGFESQTAVTNQESVDMSKVEQFKKKLENISQYKTHEGQVEGLLFLACAVLIAILGELEVSRTNKSEDK